MHSIFANLMTVAMLVHAVMGCCWHHHLSNARVPDDQSATACQSGCCSHHSSQPQPTESPCKCKAECQGVCTFLPPEKTIIEPSQVVAPLEFIPSLASLADIYLAGVDSWTVGHHLSPPASPPALYLLHQVLLI